MKPVTATFSLLASAAALAVMTSLTIANAEAQTTSDGQGFSFAFAYSANELINLSIGDIFEEEGDDAAGAFMGTWLEALIRTGVIGQIDARFKRSDNSIIPIRFTRTAIKDENNQISDILCIAKDMTGFSRIDKDLDTEQPL